MIMTINSYYLDNSEYRSTLHIYICICYTYIYYMYITFIVSVIAWSYKKSVMPFKITSVTATSLQRADNCLAHACAYSLQTIQAIF